jgi:hypothetical protein
MAPLGGRFALAALEWRESKQHPQSYLEVEASSKLEKVSGKVSGRSMKVNEEEQQVKENRK